MEVSVIIPTYNRVKDLNECLNSIIVQTTLPKEIIVIDDGDDDKTESLIANRKKELEERGVLLRYIRKKREKSLTISRNIGVENANGDIILFLDDDVILDKNYIKEILRIYEMYPNALGVQGCITNIKVSKVMNFINKIFFHGCLEKDKCRILPSTESTYPLNLNKVIKVQMIAGGYTSFKKNIFDKVRFNEKLLKSSYKEDKFFAYLLLQNYQNSLFMTPYAKLVHNVSQEGRLPNKIRKYMTQIYSLYFFYKNVDQNLKNRLIYLWSRFGYLGIHIGSFILKPSKSRLLRVKYLMGAYITCMKHIEEIKRGDLDFFNKRLRR